MAISWLVLLLRCLLLPILINATASVYLRPPIPVTGAVGAADADVLLAHHLGLRPEVSPDDVDIEALLESAGGQAALGKALLQAHSDSVLVLIAANEDDLSKLLPENLVDPSFTFDAPVSKLAEIAASYESRAHNERFKVSTVREGPRISGRGRLLDLWDFSSDSSAAQAFVQEFNTLVEFSEVGDFSYRRFGMFLVSSLPELEREYGKDSEAYQSALLALKAALSNPAFQVSNLAVIISTPTVTQALRRDSATKAQQTQAPFPAPSGNSPIYSSSTCFASAASCTNGTSECSGRGQCAPVRKGPKECFVCQCVKTKDSKNRTEWWSGASCQTKDVSTGFSLLAGTTIAIIIAIALSISLLYGIGTEELPGVLAGGAVHAKRD